MGEQTAPKAPAKKAAAKKEPKPKLQLREFPLRTVPKEAKITKVAPNPKRGKSKERYDKYRVGQTVGEAIAEGVTSADIRYDYARSYIELDPQSLERAKAKAEDAAKKAAEKKAAAKKSAAKKDAA